jgi:hypothetical protein
LPEKSRGFGPGSRAWGGHRELAASLTRNGSGGHVDNSDCARNGAHVGAYSETRKNLDVRAIAACFAPSAVHCFLRRPPLLGGSAIETFVVEDLRNRGGEYYIDRIFTKVNNA